MCELLPRAEFYVFFYKFVYFFLFYFIYLFSETGERREKERERNIHVWLPLVHPLLGALPTTQAGALTGT